MKNKSFVLLSDEQRMEKLIRVIRLSTVNTLNDEELTLIREKVDINKQYSIEMTHSAAEFCKLVILRDITADLQRTTVEGQQLFGEFEFGIHNTVFQKNLHACGKMKKARLLNEDKAAAAVIHIENTGVTDLKIPLSEDKLILYIPYPASAKEAG